MPKKDKRKKGATRSESSSNLDGSWSTDDDRSSTASDTLYQSFSSSASLDTLDTSSDSDSAGYKHSARLEEGLDALQGKSSESRQKGLLILNKILSGYVMDEVDAFISNTSTLFEAAHSFMKKNAKPEETVLACRLSALLAVTVGESCSSEGPAILDSLLDLTKPHVKPAVRRAAFDALAMWLFIGEYDGNDILERVVDMINQEMKVSFRKSNSSAHLAVASSVKCWGVLMTRVTGESLLERVFPLSLAYLLRLLSHPCLEVRLAAGQNIAYLFEVKHDLEGSGSSLPRAKSLSEVADMSWNEEDDDAYDEGDSGSGGEEVGSMEDDDLQYYDTDELTVRIVERLEELCADATRSNSKKTKQVQRRDMKMFLMAVETGSKDEDAFRLREQSVDMNSWERTIQLKMFIDMLESGIMAHMLGNSLLQGVFEFQPALAVSRSQRRGDWEANRFERQMLRAKQRGSRQDFGL